MNKEEAKKEIKKLLDKYTKVVSEGKLKTYNEEMTKKDFILPLFRALGWDIENSNEVTAEEKISKKRVDYGFRINGISKFFLEAKPLKADLDNPTFIDQAINYSWHKGCTWAVLTDFESVKIFNAEWKTENIFQNHIKTILCTEYLIRFEELWLLSRDGFEQRLLDKEAEKWGKKKKKIPIDKQLLEDFTRFRLLLSKNILKLNQKKKLTEEELDESIQRILDRLIFIRSCEDREMEAKKLLSKLRDWQSTGRKKLVTGLQEIFTYFDKEYDSNIFAKHLCDDLDIDNDVLSELIEGLYFTKDKSITYDFSAIEADVLGNIYEQYLGHILKKTEKRAKLKADSARRKEQGIYYTPTYIVDYIVRNTLGELLKDKKVNPDKIKVLDPACGSGSFLIKAFDVLREHHAKHDKNYNQKTFGEDNTTYSIKERILKNNIFGVDLDKQAVEIAQLNLLLKIAEKGRRLPLLQQNIKNGNSLIDDPAVAGDKAFKWEDEFKEIMDGGGFDIVVGNPPYGADLEEVTGFLLNNYRTIRGKMNSYRLFIEKGLNLLKNKGILGFIVPSSWLSDNDSYALREKILKETKIDKILVLPESLRVFEGVTQATTVLILKKETNSKNVMNNIVTLMDDVTKKSDFDSFVTGRIKQKKFFDLDNLSIITKDDLVKLVTKIKENGTGNLENFFIIKQGEVNLTVYKKYLRNKADDNTRPLIRGNDLQRYQIDNRESKESFVVYAHLKRDDSDKNRIVLQEVSNMAQKRRIKATILEKGANCGHTCNYLYPAKENIDIFYYLGILNSKLINFYFKVFSNTNHVSGKELRRLPIISCDNQTISNNAKKLIDLNKRLIQIKDKQTDEKVRLEKETQKLDQELDEDVYKLYGITEKEKKIIEESLKE